MICGMYYLTIHVVNNMNIKKLIGEEPLKQQIMNGIKYALNGSMIILAAYLIYLIVS